MPTRKWIGFGAIAVVAVVVAVVVWTMNSGPNFHGPPAMVEVAEWLGEESECPDGVELEASRIPVGPHGPPGTFFQLFGELPEAGALAACVDTASGYIGWFRFPSTKTMVRALRRHPEMLELHQLACTHGPELLDDSLLGNSRFVAEFCRRLGFVAYRPKGRQR